MKIVSVLVFIIFYAFVSTIGDEISWELLGKSILQNEEHRQDYRVDVDLDLSQAHPDLNSTDVSSILKEACSRYGIPDNRVKRVEPLTIFLIVQTVVLGGSVLYLFIESQLQGAVLHSLSKELKDKNAALSAERRIAQMASLEGLLDDLFTEGPFIRSAKKHKLLSETLMEKLKVNAKEFPEDAMTIRHRPVACGENSVRLQLHHTVYAETVKGKLYKVADNGVFSNKGLVYRYRDIPSLVFTAENGRRFFLNEDNCAFKGVTSVCKRDNFTDVFYLEKYPIRTFPAAPKMTLVRSLGMSDVIATNEKHFTLRTEAGIVATIDVPPGGIGQFQFEVGTRLFAGGRVVAHGRHASKSVVIKLRPSKLEELQHQDLEKMKKDHFYTEQHLKDLDAVLNGDFISMILMFMLVHPWYTTCIIIVFPILVIVLLIQICIMVACWMKKRSKDEKKDEHEDIELGRTSYFHSDSETGSVEFLSSAKHVVHVQDDDIFYTKCVGIVNAIANTLQLDGVAKSRIIKHCGPQVESAIEELKSKFSGGSVSYGEVLITPSFDHKNSQFFLHTFPPLIFARKTPSRTEECALRLCYFNCLWKAAANDITTVAFPVVGHGFFNWPSKHCIAVALQGIFAYFEVYPDSAVKSVYLLTERNLFKYEIALKFTSGETHIELNNSEDACKMRRSVEAIFNGKELKPLIPLPKTSLKVGSFVDKWQGEERSQQQIKKMIALNVDGSDESNTKTTPAKNATRFAPKTAKLITPKVSKRGQFRKTVPSDPTGENISNVRDRKVVQKIKKSTENEDADKIAMSGMERIRNLRKRRRCANYNKPAPLEIAHNSQKVVIMCSFLPEELVKEGKKKLLECLEEVNSNETTTVTWMLQKVTAKSQIWALYFAVKESDRRTHIVRREIDVLFEAIFVLHRATHLDNILQNMYMRIKKNLQKQLETKVVCPKEATDAECKARQLCRLQYHVRQRNEDVVLFKPIDDLFPEIHATFMGKEYTSNFDELNNEIDNVIRMEVENDTNGVIQQGHATYLQEPNHNSENRISNLVNALEEDGNLNFRPESSNAPYVSNDDLMEREEADADTHLVHETKQDGERDYDDDELSFLCLILPEEQNLSQHQYDDDELSFLCLDLPPEDVLHEARANETGEDDHMSQNLLPNNPDLISDDDLNSVGEAIARRMTYIRKCDDECPRLETSKASEVLAQILNYCFNKKEEQWNLLQSLFLEDGRSPIKFLKKFAPCYSGVRSVLKRIVELRDLAHLRFLIDDGCNGDLDALNEVLSFKHVPTPAQMAFAKSYIPFRNDNHHCEETVVRRFGPLLDMFTLEIQRQETKVCDICNQLTHTLHEKLPDEVQQYLTEEKKNEESETYGICRSCNGDVRKKKIPPSAVINCMETVEIPDDFKKLNWIEKALIRLISPLQTIIHLRDIAGKKTSVKGTTGAMALVPVPLTNTLDHVAESLPCAANLILQVSTTYSMSSVVDLKKVLKCLNFLRSNNRFYANVQINPYFQFTRNKEVFFDKDEDESDLIKRSTKSKNYLLTQEDIQIQPMRSVDGPPVSGLALDHYRLKNLRYEQLGFRHSGLEAKAFPWLYPTGKYHFDDPDRVNKLTFTNYTRARLLCANRQFATDIKWLCFIFGFKMQIEIANGMGTQCKITREATAADINRRINTDIRFSSSLNSIYGKFRGFAAYWNAVKLKLRAHISVFGPPTWFFTLNPADRDWKEVLEIYSKFYPEANRSNIRQLIARDPLHWCRHFHHRVNAFFKKILVPGGPLGTIIHYFRRVEYQHRGTQHVHCVVWCKERPGPHATPAEITKYIDSVVTARMPDNEKEPTLHYIIDEFQTHEHTNTCNRVVKLDGKYYKMCRFEFPRPVLSSTVLTKKDTAIAATPGCKRKKQYYLARTPDDVLTNDYCPAISLAWGANTDIQYVMHDTTDVVNYICGYVSKSEKAKGETIFGLKPGDSSFDNKRLFKNFVDLLRMKETGALEMIDVLMGHQLYQFDTKHVWIDTGTDASRSRLLVQSNIMELERDEQAFKDNWVDIYYPLRPLMFEEFSLFNMMINFTVTTATNGKVHFPHDIGNNDSGDEYEEGAVLIGSDADQEPEELGNADFSNPHKEHYHIDMCESPFFSHPAISKKGVIQFECGKLNKKGLKKWRAKVPRTFLPNPDGSVAVDEDYFRRLCMLFIPWRNEDELQGDAPSFAHRYAMWSTDLARRNKEAYEDIRKFLAGVRALKESDAEQLNRMLMMREAIDALNIDVEPEDAIPMQARFVDEEQHKANLKKMNPDQQRIFDHVMAAIELQNMSRKTGTAYNWLSLLMFVSGTAGTGKSFLINNLADAITLMYCKDDERDTRPSALLGAPTGLAAINIRGATLHSLFNLDVQHGRNKEFKEASDEQVSKARALFSNARLIIIDEISMCSAIMLTKLHLRMQRIAGNNKLFGGFNIIAFGDLLQLPPVQAPKKLSPHTVANLFKSIAPPVSLWTEFTYNELTQNMRQRNDLEFAHIMGRARVQAMTEDDIKVLQSRLIPTEEESGIPTMNEAARYYLRILDNDPTAIALFPTNVEVMEFNNAVMEELEMETFEIESEDSVTKVVDAWAQKKQGKAPLSRPYQRAEFSITAEGAEKRKKKAATFDESGRRSGGLMKKLILSIGARVMLRRNIDVPRGLVNGSMGYLKDVVTTSEGDVVALLVLFDGHKTVRKVEKVTAVVDSGKDEYRRRVQFPLTVAFAATIHKCQGMTVKNALISTRSIFSPGQAFVALSRVQNLEGLHLIDFVPKKVTVDRESLKEYNRRRQYIGLQPFAMPSTSLAAAPELPSNPPTASKQAAAALNALSLLTPGRQEPTRVEQRKKSAKRKLFGKETSTYVIEGNLLRLQNTGTDCFVITLVNLINAMEPIAEAIKANTDDTEMVMVRLRSILNGTVSDCTSLRRLLPNVFHRGHHDARDALTQILGRLPDALWNLFNVSVRVTDGCDTCGERRVQYLHLDFVALQAQNPSNTMETMFSDFRTKSRTCLSCKERVIIEQDLDILSDHKYLFCGLDRVHALGKILGSDCEGFEFSGKFWRLIGASQYLGQGVKGHYITWIRIKKNTYAILNDDAEIEIKRFPTEWNCFSLLLLERIENPGLQADPGLSPDTAN